MTAFGPAVAQSVAGVQQAAQASVREKRKAERDEERARRTNQQEDEVEIHAIEPTEAVRTTEDATREEAHEDHERQAVRQSTRKRIDLEG